ncbi:DNA repair protein rad2 [Basidiobolus ranarum]|uniref:DNA repair protein rad2 n=1 Tax=Basidiobolus ranarum TaxID=34480 RepID=A0ABR2W2Y6_9FUNG
MRDAEGKTLSNAHILGFFRRICKLLFFNIKPVFVFDGGAPTLKRSTIRERRERKERTARNLQKTAEKLLSAQLRLHALKEVSTPVREKEEEIINVQRQLVNVVASDVGKRKRDAYELPNVENEFRISVEQDKMIAIEEGDDYVFHGINTENVDINSEIFSSLPIEIQQEILLDLKNKSRQTSWHRLEHMIRSATISFFYFTKT